MFHKACSLISWLGWLKWYGGSLFRLAAAVGVLARLVSDSGVLVWLRAAWDMKSVPPN